MYTAASVLSVNIHSLEKLLRVTLYKEYVELNQNSSNRISYRLGYIIKFRKFYFEWTLPGH